MRRRIFRAVTFALLFCAAASARGQESGPCGGRPPSDPNYYADMKELPPGKFGFSYMFDRAQLDDPSSPLVVRWVNGITSAKQRAGKIACVEVENRTERVVRAVRFRWSVAASADDGRIVEGAEALARGLLPVVEVEVAPGARRKVEVHGAHFADFFQPLAASGEVNGRYNVSIGVARVEFTDGTALDLP
jgi:hypothetical protein